jgi:hypothetical protein
MDIRNFFGAKKGGTKKSGSIAPSNGGGGGGRSNQLDGKKRKQEEETAEKETEISPTDFFADSKFPSPKKTKVADVKPKAEREKAKESSKPKTTDTSPKKKKQQKKRLRVEESDDDDSDEDYNAAENMNDNDDDDDNGMLALVVEKSPTKKKVVASPKKKIKTPSPTKQKTRTASPKQKSPKTPKKTAISILEPSLEMDSFDQDSVQVSEFLQGLTFVLTGVLQNLHRDDAVDLIKTLGGRVTGAVSGKTSYLVVGPELEDGRNYTEGAKYRGAMEKNVVLCMGEKQLYGLCHLYHERAKKEKGISDTPKAPASAPKASPSAATISTTPVASSNPSAKKPVAANPYAKKPVVAANPYAKKPVAGNPYAKPAGNPYATKAGGSGSPNASNKASSSSTITTTQQDKDTPKDPNTSNQLWADRHAPKYTREILGNKENINKLARCKCQLRVVSCRVDKNVIRQYPYTFLFHVIRPTTYSGLEVWERNFNNPNAAKKTFSNPKQGPWKAALLSGPPGIGSTYYSEQTSLDAQYAYHCVPSFL